ncbi:MAG: ABC transporter ATP-binding protein [Chloroflexota bacterium]|jgi:ABC-type nitrate/sulfonate/bicarbonate transport system ATPase subunit|nr:ABC transporter ATP-binding protein [Anaerolineae bacterium]
MSTQTAPKIVLENVNKVFDTPQGPVEALRHTSLQIGVNEMVCIVGPSGCGKSTILNLIAGFISPTEGRVLVNNHPVTGPGADRAVVFQQDSVFPWLTVAKNLEYGPRARGIPADERKEIVAALLRSVGLEGYADLLPRQLSGGMKKRVDLARAYANRPEVLLMDEPFGALDVMTKEKMQLELLRLWKQDARTVVFVTHDIEEALFVGHRVLIMTARPARVAGEIVVPFEISLDPHIKTGAEFQRLRENIMDLLSAHEGGNGVRQ